MNYKKIKSLAFLGVHFFIHIFCRIFGINRRHKDAFLKAYQADQIFPITVLQRQQMPDYSKCLHCFLCDYACPEIKIGKLNFLAPSYIVSAFSRSLTDFNYFDTQQSCASCQKCEDACPENVPIKNIISFILDRKPN